MLIALGFVLLAGHARADDRIVVRGNYYREASTRVLQPLVAITVDAPDERLTVGATYLLDAISSASIAAGTQQVTGGDRVFTELRHEVTAQFSSKLDRVTVGGFFRYSSESDYRSRRPGISLAVDVFDKAGTVGLAYSYGRDRVFQITNNTGNLRKWTSTSDDNLLQTHYLALSYAHALHPTVLGTLSAEGIRAIGVQDNPYRGNLILNAFPESHPLLRNRLALNGTLRWMIPRARVVIEPRYRFYMDDWDIRAHAIDSRIHIRIPRHVILRVRYRYYTQTASFFWRDDGVYTGDPDEYRTADPKMEAWYSHTPGLQVIYELDGLARYKGLAWLAGGWIEATYNHVFQTSSFGNARLGNLAFSFAF